MSENTTPETKAKAQSQANQEQTPELATAKQLGALVKFGVAFEQPLSKQEAGRLIEEATRQLDRIRNQEIKDDLETKRLAFEKVKLEKEIQEHGVEDGVELELARIRGRGQSATRKTGLSK